MPLPETEKKVRVYVDGCFDMVHFGHANALRQARALGDVLVVGVHNDEEIMLNKGPTVFTQEERYETVKSIKWVDEVIVGAPYTCTVEVLEKYNCDFCAHGDDISINSEGNDTYAKIKESGRYREFPRTQGVSTTDLVGRMLLATKDHHHNNSSESILENNAVVTSPYTFNNSYVPNSVQISLFGGSNRQPDVGEKVIYAPGSFDLFHVGHIKFLKKCFAEGSYVIVGLYGDKLSNELYGHNYPIMTMHERLLSVLSCRYVANVVIEAPFEISDAFLKHFKVDKVAVGKVKEKVALHSKLFEAARVTNKLVVLDSESNFSTRDLIQRIVRNRELYDKRNALKNCKEVDFIGSKDA